MIETELKKLTKSQLKEKALEYNIDITGKAKKELIDELMLIVDMNSKKEVDDIISEIKSLTEETEKSIEEIEKEVEPRESLFQQVIPVSVVYDVLLRSGNILDKNDVVVQGTRGSITFNFDKAYSFDYIEIISANTSAYSCFKEVLLLSHNKVMNQANLPALRNKLSHKIRCFGKVNQIEFQWSSKYGIDSKSSYC